MATFTIDDARAWTTRVFVAHGARESAARSVARALVDAEVDGLKGHGLSRIAPYTAMLKTGKIDGKAVPQLKPLKPGVIMIDAACGFAYPAIDLACDALPAMAKHNGIALAGITRSSHAGAVGHHVERLAAQGLVAMFFANTPEAIAPWGGKRGVFGTNPIGFAAPLPGRAPIVIDMAVSRVARAAIVGAKAKGERIPEGWALDVDGKPTTDPDAAMKGTMVPMGDAKGAALALMVEVLAAALVGSHLAIETTSFLDADGPPPETGQSLIVIDPDSLGHGSFGAAMTRMAAAIESQEGARLPGTRRLRLRERATQHGIDIPDAMLAKFGV